MKYFLLFLMFVALPVSTVTGQVSQSPAMTAAELVQFDALRNAGNAALYDFDYDRALKEFKELDRQFPTHPAGPQLLAARVWIGPDAGRPGTTVIARAHGIREAVVGAIGLHTIDNPQVGPRWQRTPGG